MKRSNLCRTLVVSLTSIASTALLTASVLAAPPTNLVTNGNFSAGNTGFTSAYTYQGTIVQQQPQGTYTVGSNPNTYHNLWASFGDHTTGSGQMIIFNGSNVPETNAWTNGPSGNQLITVTQNTNYYFSAWVTSVYFDSPAILRFSINDAQQGANFTASSATPGWQQFYTVWNSGSATTAKLTILNQNTDLGGNDFALDDITFSTNAVTGGTNVAAAAPEPGSIALLLTAGVPVVGLVRRHSKRRTQS